MYNRDYSKEIGLDSRERIVPLRYLIPIAALLAALCWFGARTWLGHGDGGQATTTNSTHVAVQS
jgi:hypothetical protein